jgi:hypothetical protein
VICGLSLYCCTEALVKPKVCIAGSSTACCFYSGASFPFSDDYVPGPICAIYYLTLLPGPAG